MLLCKHCFHYKCIKSWKKKRNACPFCDIKILYHNISLSNNFHNNVNNLIREFNVIESERCKLNKRWCHTKIPAFNKYYLTYQLCKLVKIRLNEAEEHGLLDTIQLLSNVNIQRQNNNWKKICRSLKIKCDIILS